MACKIACPTSILQEVNHVTAMVDNWINRHENSGAGSRDVQTWASTAYV